MSLDEFHLLAFRTALQPPGNPRGVARLSGKPTSNRDLRAALRSVMGRYGRDANGTFIATTAAGLRIWINATRRPEPAEARPLWEGDRTVELARQVYDIPLLMRGKVVQGSRGSGALGEHHAAAFRQATSAYVGSEGRWAERAGQPMTNAELRQALRNDMGESHGVTGPGIPTTFADRRSMCIWVDPSVPCPYPDREKPTWRGADVVELARLVYDIPKPGTAIEVAQDTTPSAFASARTALAKARTTVEAKDVHDRAEGLRAYARLAADRGLEIEAAEIRIRAARRLGEMLAETPRNRGDANPVLNADRVPPSLPELGITRNLSSYAQKLASLSAAEFHDVMESWRTRFDGSTERVTTSVVRELERRRRDASLGDPPPMPRGEYRVIYADPPWDFAGGQGRGATNHYPTMRVGDIKALPVERLAKFEGAALFLWCPCAYVPYAIDVMTAWGFTFRTVAFVWQKRTAQDERDRLGMGFWTRIQTELVLLGTRARVSRLETGTRVEQIVRSPVGAHSAKPAEVCERIEALLNGPYIELFARGDARPGWATWGLEAKPVTCPCCGYEGAPEGRACRKDGVCPGFCRRCPEGVCPKNCAGAPEGPA